MTAIELLDFLGFIIHPNNSFFKPKQNITFLELNINSRDMKISLTRKKRHSYQTLQNPRQTIKYKAWMIGLWNMWTFITNTWKKINALKKSKGSFDAKMLLENYKETLSGNTKI